MNTVLLEYAVEVEKTGSITQAAGKPYAVVSIFHGCTLDFSVPFLVTFFCTL